jgi:hypothetical protein
MQGLLDRFREFPEFRRLTDALAELHANELRVTDAEAQAFSKTFASFARTLPPLLAQRLSIIQSAAAEKIAVSRALHPALVALEANLEVLRMFQVEITDLTALVRSTEENARRSQESAANGESEDSIADRLLANQIQRANQTAIAELRAEFLDKLARILRADAELRRDACSKYVMPGRSIVEALISYQGLQDARIDGLRSRLAELEEETLE